jgi:hypothetical protein
MIQKHIRFLWIVGFKQILFAVMLYWSILLHSALLILCFALGRISATSAITHSLFLFTVATCFGPIGRLQV